MMQRILLAADLENKPGRVMQAVKWLQTNGWGLTDQEVVIKARALYRLGQACQAVSECRDDLWGCLEIFEAMNVNHPGTVDLCRIREQWRSHKPVDESGIIKNLAVLRLPLHPVLCEILEGVLADRGQKDVLLWKPLICTEIVDAEVLDSRPCKQKGTVTERLACIWQSARKNQDIELTKQVDQLLVDLKDDLILMVYADRIRERIQDIVYQMRSVVEVMAEPSTIVNGKP